MKGIVFVKFNEFVEELWGDAFWESLIDEVDLPSEGVYTSACTIDDSELFTLISLIVQKKGITADQAQLAFGKWVFKELLGMAPAEAHQFKDVFEFLHGVQNLIHVEVRKLNPDAILPEFIFLEESPERLVLEYQSPRHLCRFCEGLIRGLGEHIGQAVEVNHKECVHQCDSRCVMEVLKL